MTGRGIRIKIGDSPHQEERGLQPESSLHQEERGLQADKGTLDAAQKTPRVSVPIAIERECGLHPETRAPDFCVRLAARDTSTVAVRLACGSTDFACRLLQNASFKHSIQLLLVNLGD